MPYEPIPYAPDEVYSNRDYTRQQMELLQQQADREGAYAQRRGALMADRWKGLGGLATETLADLVKSRDLRDAKAEAKRRYDVEQARIVAEDARVAEADRVNAAERLYLQQQRRANQIREDVGVAGTLTDEQAAAMEAARPGSTEAFTSPARTSPTLASVNRPPSQMGDLPFRSVRFGDEAPVPALDDVSGNVRNIERQAPPSTWLGPALVAGTSETPATSGTRMRMTGAQGKALEKDVAMRTAIQSLVSNRSLSQEQADFLKENPDLPAPAVAQLFPAPRPAATPRPLPSTYEALAVQLFMQADAEPDPAKKAELMRRANDATARDSAQRASNRPDAVTYETVLNQKGDPVSVVKGSQLPPGFRPYSATSAAPIPFTDAEKAQTKTDILDLATRLLNDPGLKSIYGSLDSRTWDLSEASVGRVADVERLVNLLTLGNLGKMKGILSDTDIKILSTSATTIGNRGYGIERARTELKRIIDRITPQQPSPMTPMKPFSSHGTDEPANGTVQ